MFPVKKKTTREMLSEEEEGGHEEKGWGRKATGRKKKMRKKRGEKRRKREEERKETRTTRESGVWNVEGDGKCGEGKDSSLGPQLMCSGWAVIVFTSPWAAPPGIHSYRSESLRFSNLCPVLKKRGMMIFPGKQKGHLSILQRSCCVQASKLNGARQGQSPCIRPVGSELLRGG